MLAPTAASGELRVEVVEGLRADLRDIAIAERGQVAVDDPAVLLQRRTATNDGSCA
jgi:hypothetical protein